MGMGQSFLLLNSTLLKLMYILYQTPQNLINLVPETQEISPSPSNNHEEDFIDVDTIPETQTFSNAPGKYISYEPCTITFWYPKSHRDLCLYHTQAPVNKKPKKIYELNNISKGTDNCTQLKQCRTLQSVLKKH